MLWRGKASFNTSPPPLDDFDFRHPRYSPLYSNVPLEQLPKSESMNDMLARVVPFWIDTVTPAVLNDKNVIVVGHSNSIRSLM